MCYTICTKSYIIHSYELIGNKVRHPIFHRAEACFGAFYSPPAQCLTALEGE